MKKTRLFLFGIALTALAGCALFSLNPFYTPQNRIDVPLEARGLWSGDRLHLKILPDGTVEYRSFAGEKTVELELGNPQLRGKLQRKSYDSTVKLLTRHGELASAPSYEDFCPALPREVKP